MAYIIRMLSLLERGESMKVFLSYGMNDVSEEDQKFMKAFLTRLVYVIFADEKEIEIVSNEGMKGGPDDGHLYYLGGAIQKIDKCDVIIFSPDFFNYSGCYIEHCVAEEYSKLLILLGYRTIVFADGSKFRILTLTPEHLRNIINEHGGIDNIVGISPMTFDNV